MSGLKTLLAALTLAAGADALRAGDDIVWTFASCTGRLSAQMEHQWLVSDPASEQTQARRDAMISLLEATMAPEDGPAVLNWRIEAKYAQAQLLTRAHFNQDESDAAWARNRADAQIAACNGLLLS